MGTRTLALGTALLATLVATEGQAQEVDLIAGGDIEWSRLPYMTPVAYMSEPGDWSPVPYLNLPEHLDSIRARIGSEVLDRAYTRSHYNTTIQGRDDMGPGEEDGRHLFKGIRHLIQDADIAFANLEMPLSDRAQMQQTSSVGAMAFAGVLEWAGFDVISLSNNRMLDAETTGLLDSIEAFEDTEIGAVGAGKDLEEARQAYILEREGMRFAFLAYTYGVSWVGIDGFARPGGAGVMPMDPLIIREDIQRVRDEVDYVVVSFHWGVGPRESLDIAPGARKFAHDVVDMGADVIIGHHPHVPKGVELYNDGVILYSLANVAFGHSHDYFRDNYLARVIFTPERISRVELVPIAGHGRDVIQPFVLEGERSQVLLEKIQEMSARLDTEMKIQGNLGVIQP